MALYKLSDLSLSVTGINDDAHITVEAIPCPSVGDQDSLNISVLYHCETEIVLPHTRCQAGSCLDKNKIINTEKRKAFKETCFFLCNIYSWTESLTLRRLFGRIWALYLRESSRK